MSRLLLDELRRIFLGDSSWTFIPEIVFRTFIMYVYALLLVRLLGKRGLGTLAPFELAVVIALGTALGDPMLMRDVPVAHAMVVVAVVVGLQRLLVATTVRFRFAEHLFESEPRCLVRDGIIQVESVRKEGFSHDDLFLSLRQNGIQQLGEVKRAFLETSGHVSVWRFAPADVRQGLPLFPDFDLDCPTAMTEGKKVDSPGLYSCQQCGTNKLFRSLDHFNECSKCQASCWVPSSSTPSVLSP